MFNLKLNRYQSIPIFYGEKKTYQQIWIKELYKIHEIWENFKATKEIHKLSCSRSYILS